MDFASWVGNPQMRRVYSIYCSMPFYVTDLSILRFWYMWGPWNQYPLDTKG